MRILTACEYSGIVRDAFSALGHEAWSCDLLPSESPGLHYQGDVRDMMFAKLKCKWAIENPVGIMSKLYRKPDQIINPWQFGDPVSKKTCLWLSGLPPLMPTKIVEPSKYITAPSGRRYPEWHWKSGGGSGKKRSQFFPGIAQAMAEQWSF